MEDAASRASVSEDYAACYPSSESQIVSNPAVAEDIPGTETASQEASSRCKIPICGPLHPLDSASAQLVFASCANVFPHPLLLAQAVLGIESIDFSDFLQNVTESGCTAEDLLAAYLTNMRVMHEDALIAQEQAEEAEAAGLCPPGTAAMNYPGVVSPSQIPARYGFALTSVATKARELLKELALARSVVKPKKAPRGNKAGQQRRTVTPGAAGGWGVDFAEPSQLTVWGCGLDTGPGGDLGSDDPEDNSFDAQLNKLPPAIASAPQLPSSAHPHDVLATQSSAVSALITCTEGGGSKASSVHDDAASGGSDAPASGSSSSNGTLRSMNESPHAQDDSLGAASHPARHCNLNASATYEEEERKLLAVWAGEDASAVSDASTQPDCSAADMHSKLNGQVLATMVNRRTAASGAGPRPALGLDGMTHRSPSAASRAPYGIACRAPCGVPVQSVGSMAASARSQFTTAGMGSRHPSHGAGLTELAMDMGMSNPHGPSHPFAADSVLSHLRASRTHLGGLQPPPPPHSTQHAQHSAQHAAAVGSMQAAASSTHAGQGRVGTSGGAVGARMGPGVHQYAGSRGGMQLVQGPNGSIVRRPCTVMGPSGNALRGAGVAGGTGLQGMSSMHHAPSAPDLLSAGSAAAAARTQLQHMLGPHGASGADAATAAATAAAVAAATQVQQARVQAQMLAVAASLGPDAAVAAAAQAQQLQQLQAMVNSLEAQALGNIANAHSLASFQHQLSAGLSHHHHANAHSLASASAASPPPMLQSLDGLGVLAGVGGGTAAVQMKGLAGLGHGLENGMGGFSGILRHHSADLGALMAANFHAGGGLGSPSPFAGAGGSSSTGMVPESGWGRHGASGLGMGMGMGMGHGSGGSGTEEEQMRAFLLQGLAG